jgi:hypothetical protein
MEYYISNYLSNKYPSHHIDINYTDEGQKEVYEYCKQFMKEHNLYTVVDVGCGSGYKLINILGEFNTIGIETEPCYSTLKNKYSSRKWLLSGEIEKSFIDYPELHDPDVIICCDVIEHIVNPDDLLNYLLSLNAKYYIISTPCREILCNHPKFSNNYKQSYNGPPINNCHVREWTMTEFKHYLETKFSILYSSYCENQIECQFHLVTIK